MLALDLLGASIDTFDAMRSYYTGETASKDGVTWRATDNVAPPFLYPWLTPGDQPGGSNNKWVQVNGIVVGMFDMGPLARQMSTLRAPTVAIARALLKQGQATINEARTRGANLPNQAGRDECFWKLDYYQKDLAKQTDPTAPYSQSDDLKKWVLQAFIEANAVEEGATYAQQNWDNMWTDIGTELLKLPEKARAAVVSTATWLLPWYIWAFGAAAVGSLLYATYKVILASAPAATSTIVKRYLP